MSENVSIKNGVITAAKLQFARSSFLEVWVWIRHDGGEQGFGGFVLGGNPFEDYPAARHSEQPNLAAEFIGSVLKIAGVDDWAALRGSVIRVEIAEDYGTITGIGHAVDDLWFRPEQRFAAMLDARHSGQVPE